jgi:putative transposase
MEMFKQMVNDCVRIGLANNASTLKRLSYLSYPHLSKYRIVSYYKAHAISKAAGLLANRKQSIKRGYATKNPYQTKAMCVSSVGFKVSDGILRVPLRAYGRGKNNMDYFDIPLNRHTRTILSDSSVRVRSFTLTSDNTLSICYSKEVPEIACTTTAGADRNLRNLTVVSGNSVFQYELSKAVDVVENTRAIVRSFNRPDVRVRKKIASKYGHRRRNRVNQLLQYVSKQVVKEARREKAAIVLEDLRYIRRLYQKGNYQGRDYRSRLNGWSFAEIKRQITYKAQWEGVPIIELSAYETRGTSQLCPQCGKRLQEAHYKDVFHKRQLYCIDCLKWMDRDVVAAMNIARKGAEVLQRSKGLAGEAMRGNPTTPVILRVDASKLSHRRKIGLVGNSTQDLVEPPSRLYGGME